MEIISDLLIIIIGIAIILTIYGSYLIYDDLKKASVAYGIACALMVVVLFFVINTKENSKVIETNEPIQEEVQSQQENVHEPLSGCTTHVAAEIYDQYQNEDGTYSNVFGVDTVKFNVLSGLLNSLYLMMFLIYSLWIIRILSIIRWMMKSLLYGWI